MPLLRIPLLLCLLLLAACSDPRTTVLSRLRQADADEIRAEVAQLHAKYFAYKGAEFFPVRADAWPPGIQKLRPLRMTLYQDGLAIAIHDEPGHELGIHVIPPGHIVAPKSTARTLYQPIRDGFLYYSQTR